MKGFPIKSPFFDSMEEFDEWEKKQNERDDFEVLSSGGGLYNNGKWRGYVYGYKTDMDSRFKRTFGFSMK